MDTKRIPAGRYNVNGEVKHLTLQLLAASPRHNTRNPPRTPGSVKSKDISSATSGFVSGSRNTSEANPASRVSTAKTRPLTGKSRAQSAVSRATLSGFSDVTRPHSGVKSVTRVNDRLHVDTNLSDSLLSLIEAAEKGDEDRVSDIMLTYEPSVLFKRLKEVRTPLHRAAGYGQLNTIQQLIQAGADVSGRSELGSRTALHEACVGGHTQVVQLLASAMPGVNQPDGCGQTAVHVAAANGEAECIRVLANARGVMNTTDDQGRNPAHLAAARNHVHALTALAEFHCDLDGQDLAGKTPAHAAAQHGAFEALSFLISRDVNFKQEDLLGQQPVHVAAAHNHLACLRGLVRRAGCEWDATDARGRTAAHHAAIQGSTDCLHWLLENLADPNIQDGDGNTVLHSAAIQGKADCFNCCLQHGASQEATNHDGETPIEVSRRTGHPVAIGKALSDIKCELCVKKHQRHLWDNSHPTTPAQHRINRTQRTAYRTNVPGNHNTKRPATQLEQNKQKYIKEQPFLPKEAVVAKFYGHIN